MRHLRNGLLPWSRLACYHRCSDIHMKRFSIKQILTGILILITLMVSFLVAFVIPAQIDSELSQRLGTNLLSTLRTDLGWLREKVGNELEVMKRKRLEHTKQSFNREKNALVKGLVARVHPMVEDFEMEAIDELAQNALDSTSNLVGIQIRTEIEGDWKDFGIHLNPAARLFSSEKKTDYSYTAVKMFFVTNELEQALQEDEKSFAAIVSKIRDANTGLMEKTEQGIDQLQIQMSEAVHTRIIILAVVTVVIMAAVMFMLLILLDRIIIKPLRSTVDTLNQVAEGDLRADIQVHGKNEVSQLLRAMKTMVEKVRVSIRQVAGATSKMATTAEQTSVITEQTSQAIQVQLAETTKVASAIGEMSSTVQEVAENTNNTALTANQANEEATDGRGSMEETIGQIQRLASEIESMTSVLKQLEKNSDEISGVLDVIRGIAEQTNLLALNAAIEAARAGEQGRGFAVVADEVRTLANRTQDSTQEIQQMIEKFQTGSRHAVATIKQSREKVDSAVEQANKTGSAFAVITEAIKRINDMSTQIATAAEEQSRMAVEINSNVMRINEMAEQTSTGAQQISIANGELSELAADLQTGVAYFRV